MSAQQIMMTLGLALIIFGAILAGVQFAISRRQSVSNAGNRDRAGVPGKTTYVGLVIIAIGAILETIGYFM